MENFSESVKIQKTRARNDHIQLGEWNLGSSRSDRRANTGSETLIRYCIWGVRAMRNLNFLSLKEKQLEMT